MRIGIDLLWVRPGKNGGTESYIRNMLDGFDNYSSEHTFVLFVSKDNADTFKKYKEPIFKMVICPVETSSLVKRVIWSNFHFLKLTKIEEIDLWFFPVYSRPCSIGNVPAITVIHDLQALHFPEYFSLARNLFFRMMWKYDCNNSVSIITISEFCKKDIIQHYKADPNRVEVIYNPIIIKDEFADFSYIEGQYAVKSGEYYYTVSSIAKHKNLITILKMIKTLKDRGIDEKLVISGVKINAEGEIRDYISKNGLEDNVVYTGFVTNEIRNTFYKHCKAFLFPSIFEGFGMPPLEAAAYNAPVLTTNYASIGEVTGGLLNYVEDPFNEHEWAQKIEEGINRPNSKEFNEWLAQFDSKVITEQYILLFEKAQKYAEK